MSSSLRARRGIAALLRIPTLVALAGLACATEPQTMSTARRDAIADTLRGAIASAYDLSRPGDAVTRLMSLYPPAGDVVSASGGRVTTAREPLEEGIRAFWENVGRNMREPRWTWGPMHVDVLSPDAAVVTTTYRVPHLTPAGRPHVIAGAWTAVFQRRAGRWAIVQEHLSDLPSAPPAPSPAATPAPDAEGLEGHEGHRAP